MSLNLANMSTETRNPSTMLLDTMTPLEIVTAMNQEDARIAQVIQPELPHVAQCVAWGIASIQSGGRIIYMGAGTSGRLGVLDAVECPPTFGVDPSLVVGLIAGGPGHGELLSFVQCQFVGKPFFRHGKDLLMGNNEQPWMVR